jgi:hypothetical protein
MTDNTAQMIRVPFQLAWSQASALLQKCNTTEAAEKLFRTARQIASHNSFDDAQTGINRLIQGQDVSGFLPKEERPSSSGEGK